MSDPYTVLELNQDATLSDIKTTFRRLALLYHPDRNKDPNSAEKFRIIAEAHEILRRKWMEKEGFADVLLNPGKIDIVVKNESSFVELTQGNAYFYGTISNSENKQFSVAFQDGYGTLDKWINGKLLFIEKDELLWIKDIDRPLNAHVSNNGRVAVLHTVLKQPPENSSSPKEFVNLGCKLGIMEKSGEEIFTHEFGSNSFECLISHNGDLVLVATLEPDNSIYCFNINNINSKGLKISSFSEERKKVFWKYTNHSHKVISRVQLTGNIIEVFTGNSLISTNRDYALFLDGTLLPEYARQLETLIKMKNQKPAQKTELLITMINSRLRKEEIEGLSLLARFVRTKSSLAYYSKIAESIEKFLKNDDTEISDMVWKIILGIVERNPHVMDIYAPKIITKLKKTGRFDESYLFKIGHLGRANPKWVIREIPLIEMKLKSQHWNERRFAAFAIARIGSSDIKLVEHMIPLLIEYAKDVDKLRQELGGRWERGRVVYDISPVLTESCPIEFDNATMIRDACIDALGEMGKNFPNYVEFAIPILETISRDAPSIYSVKKALRAIEAIKGGYHRRII